MNRKFLNNLNKKTALVGLAAAAAAVTCVASASTASAATGSALSVRPAGETWCADPGVLDLTKYFNGDQTDVCFSDAGNWGTDITHVDHLYSGNNAGYLVFEDSKGDWTYSFAKYTNYDLNDIHVIAVHIN